MLFRLCIVSALLGYSVSYKSFYLFHLVFGVFLLCEIFRFFSLGRISLVKGCFPYVFAIFMSCTFACITFFWSRSMLSWFEHSIFLMFGVLIVLSFALKVKKRGQLFKVFKVLAIVSVVNIVLGFLESTTSFRYPLSPYSELAPFFGYPVFEFWRFNEETILKVLSLPTGLNGNPNNFGFYIMLWMPFVYFSTWHYLLKLTLLFAVIFLIFAIGSRGLFLAFLIFLIFVVIISISERTLYNTFFLVSALLLSISFGLAEGFGGKTLRMLGVFDTVSELSVYLDPNLRSEETSTGVRGIIYELGVRELFSSGGVGLGLGGASALLVERGISVKSFHFFLLELIVDFGYFFIVGFIFYLALSVGLIVKSFAVADKKLSSLSRASGFSLLVAIPASIAPSGLYYFLPYYVFVGFSLSTYYITKRAIDLELSSVSR